MITLLEEHLGIEPPGTIKLVKSSRVYDIRTLIKVEILAQSNRDGSYFWRHRPSRSSYLRLPRLDGMALSYGPLASDFFIPPDSNVAPYLGNRTLVEIETNEKSHEENESDGTKGSRPSTSIDWSI